MTAFTPRAGVIGFSTRANRVRAIARRTTVAVLGAIGAIALGSTVAGSDGPWIVKVAFAASAMMLALAAAIDATRERIPNRLVLASLMMVGVTPVILGDARLLAAAAVGLVLGGLPMSAVLLTRGIGIGDVKFAAALGATAGFVHPLAALGAVFIAASASSTYAAVRRIQRLALGPWLWCGFVASTALASFFTASFTEGLH